MRSIVRPGLAGCILLGVALGALSSLANAGILSSNQFVPKVLAGAYLWVATAGLVAWTARTGVAAATRTFAFLATAVFVDTAIDYALEPAVLTAIPMGVGLWQVLAIDLWWLAPGLLLAALFGFCVYLYNKGGWLRVVVAVPPLVVAALAVRDVRIQSESPLPDRPLLELARIVAALSIVVAVFLIWRVATRRIELAGSSKPIGLASPEL